MTRALDMAALSKNGERDHLGARFTSKLSNANETIVGAVSVCFGRVITGDI